MKLMELELTNIKSYKHEIIRFSEGINCILGLNGSGKSTIIESIGSVLCNYNQRTTNNLLRYNETKGQISLLFEGNDNKIYRIIKNLRNRGNSNIKIVDEENSQVLHETVSDVYVFVKKVLNIPKEKSISKLFEEIIAVPQGTFVNAFLETPKNRKENFDKLFELDIYKKLADEVKVLSDKVQKEYVFNLEKDIATLNGNLNNYDRKVQECNDITNKLKDLKQSLQNITDIYNKKEQEKSSLEKEITKLDKLNNDKRDILNAIDNINNQINIYKESLEKAIEAKKIVLDNEFGYNLYIKTNKELKEHEKLYNEYLELNNKLNENNISISSLKESNKHLKQYIHDLKVQSGITSQKIIDTEKVINENKEKVLELEKEKTPLQEQIKKLEEIKTQTQARYAVYLDKLNNTNTHLLSINLNNNITNDEKRIIEIEEKLSVIKENKDKIIELEKEKIKINSELNNLKINNDYISDGLCPILKQKCLNIKGNTLSDEINSKINKCNEQLNDINKEINNLLLINSQEESLVQEKNIILLAINNYQKEEERFESVINDLLVTFSHENLNINKENINVVVSELIRKYQNLNDNYQNEELDILKQKDIKISNTIFSSNNQNQINVKLIKDLEENVNKYKEDISKKDQEYFKNDFDINRLEEDNNKILDKLEKHQNIKQKIDDNKVVLEKYLNNYNTYISKLDESNNKDKYEKLVSESNESLNRLKDKLNLIDEDIKKIDKTISKDQLALITNEVNELKNSIAVTNNTIKINEGLLENINNELIILNGYIKEKEEKEEKLQKYNNLDNKYKLIRNVFSNLPKELSKQIRKYISTYSSSLYRKISKENVRIELLDDYEVVLIDCLDETKAKTLSQLSGGEQMSVAIAIRLAMLKQITNVEFYFMDEPTINLDYERRMMVGEVVKDISSELKQLFVISHDDTFESITDNNIKICKVNNNSLLEN